MAEIVRYRQCSIMITITEQLSGTQVVRTVQLLFAFVRHCCHTPGKAMAPHSSPLAWKVPWTEEPGGLQSMGSLRVGHD